MIRILARIYTPLPPFSVYKKYPILNRIKTLQKVSQCQLIRYLEEKNDGKTADLFIPTLGKLHKDHQVD
jgi:hypothetical protein